MNSYEETFKTWNKVASLYETRFMDLDLYNDTYDLFCELLPGLNTRILEIGCGPGNITRYLLSRRSDFKIEGIDIAPNMIILAQKHNPAAVFRVMDSRNILQLQDRFDAIMCGFCLPYLSETDSARFINDCNTLLPVNGIFYLSFVEGDYAQSGYQSASSGDRTYFYYYSTEYLQQVLAENNFELVSSVSKSYTRRDGTEEIHRILLSQKTEGSRHTSKDV